MASKPIPLAWGRGPITDKDGNPTPQYLRWLQDIEAMVRQSLTYAGAGGIAQIQAQVPIVGRTEGIATTVTGLATTGDIKATTKIIGRSEGIGTTVQQLNTTGQLNSLLNVVADRNTDNISDGTGSPLTGGKRGFSNINTDGSYVVGNYHLSAARTLAGTNQTGNTADNTGTFQTVASFNLVLPSSATLYKGTLTVSKGAGGAAWTDQAQIKIGALTSNVLSFNNPATSASGTVTVSGLSGGAVTVLVQVSQSADVAATITGTFVQSQYTDQDPASIM